MKIIRENNLRFDENLPLYGWQEDVDFSLQIAPFGRLAKSDKLLGVHLGSQGWQDVWRSFGLFPDCRTLFYLRERAQCPGDMRAN